MNSNDLNTDKDLFRRIAQNDVQAFSILFQSYSNPLYWHAFKLVNTEFWAEELVQETFVQLWLKRDSLINIENPSSYLYKIIANKALDRMRRQELEIKMQYIVANVLHNFTEEHLVQSDKWDKIKELLQQAVNMLPEQRKRIYQLKYQQGYSYEEIAEELSISKHTVRNQMAKALEAIRSFLMKNGDFLQLVLYLVFFI